MKTLDREDCAWQFASVAGQPIGEPITEKLLHFRLHLIKEELAEVEEASDALLYEHMCGRGMTKAARADFLKELCDLQYVLSGLLVATGLDDVFDEAFKRVHESNMSKFPAIFNDAGKVMKGLNYKPPNLEDLV